MKIKRILAMLLVAVLCITLAVAAEGDAPLIMPAEQLLDQTVDTPDPEGTSPEGTNPEGTSPDGTNPDSTNPEGTSPEGTSPDGTNPDSTNPEGTNPDPAKPEKPTDEKTEAPKAPPTESKIGSSANAPGNQTSGIQTTQDIKKAEEGKEEDGKPITMGFTGVARTVRQNNLTIRANDQTLQGIKTVDYKTMEQELSFNQSMLEGSILEMELAINAVGAIAEAPADDSGEISEADRTLAQTLTAYLNSAILSTRANISGLQAQIKSVQETAADSNEDYAVNKRQFQGVADQLVMRGESVFLTITALELQQQDLQRQLTALDRTVREQTRRYELGQISELQLLKMENQRAQFSGSIETLKVQIKGLKSDLAVLTGNRPTATLVLSPLPSAPAGTRNYDADLKLAIQNSYTLFSSEDAMKKASNDYEHNRTSSVHLYEGKKIAYEAAEQQLIASFGKLYSDIEEKQRAFAQAQEDEAFQQRLYNTAATKYQRGMIAKNEMQTTKDDYDTAKSATEKAKLELFVSITQYEWAKKGIMA